ncbi:MAG: lipopolysaccharide biosynthesis protein [Bacteroidales bacterium]
MSSLKKLFGDTAIYGLSSVLGRFLNWALFPLYVAVLKPEEYGIVTQLYAYVAVLLVILTYGMETSFFRFAADKENRSNSFSTSFIALSASTFLFLVILWFTRTQSASYLGGKTLPSYVFIMALIVGLDVISSIPFSYLRLENKAKIFAAYKLINIAINIVANLFFLLLCPYLIRNMNIEWLDDIYLHDNKEMYIFISNLLASAVTLVMLFPYIRKHPMVFDKQLLRKMLNYGIPIMFVGLMGMLGLQSDKLLLPKLIGEDSNALRVLGIYGANTKIAVLLTMFTQAFRYAFEPFFFSRGKDADRGIYADTLNFFVLAGLIAFLGILLYQEQIKLIIPREYWEGLEILPFILLGNLFLGVYYVLSVWYKLTDMTKYGAFISVLGVISIIVLNFALVPNIGMIGSAMAMMFGYGLMCIISYVLGQKYFYVDYRINKALIYLISSLLIYTLSLFVRQHIHSEMGFFVVNTLLFSLFFALIYYMEKDSIRLAYKQMISKRKANT